MHSQHIQILIDDVERSFGPITYYGSSEEEEHGVGFLLPGVKVTFSVLTLDGALESSYDVQIEGVPPGNYVFMAEVVREEFIRLVHIFSGPESGWP